MTETPPSTPPAGPPTLPPVPAAPRGRQKPPRPPADLTADERNALR